ASSGATPCAISSRVRISMWKSSSSSTWRWVFMRYSCGTQDARHDGREFQPFARLDDELATAGFGETVEAGFATELGHAPVGLDQAAALEAVEGRIERAVFYGQRAISGIREPAGDRIAVAWAELQGAQDERVEGAVEAILAEHWPRYPDSLGRASRHVAC